MKIDIGKPFRHRGEWGSRVTVEFDAQDGGAAVYDLATHGKDAGAIRAEIVALRASHRVRMKRHADLAAVRGTKIAGWTVTDSYVDRRGTEMHMHVIAWSADGSERVEFEAWHPDAAQLPNNATVIADLTKSISDHVSGKAAAAAATAAAVVNLA